MRLIPSGGSRESFDRGYRSRAHAKNGWVRILNQNTNWKSLSDPHPIEIAFNKWHPLNLDVVVLGLHRRRDSFDYSFESTIRVRQQIDLCGHTGTDTF